MYGRCLLNPSSLGYKLTSAQKSFRVFSETQNSNINIDLKKKKKEEPFRSSGSSQMGSRCFFITAFRTADNALAIKLLINK